MLIDKILVAIDFEKETNNIVSYAGYFSLKTGSSLEFLNVIDYITTPPSYLLKYIEEEKKAIEKRFIDIKNILEKYNINLRLEIVVGRLQESFQRYVDEKAPKMLIIGFSSHQFRRSSSEKIIKSLKVPMLVVRGVSFKEIDVESVLIKKILCPVDLSEPSKKALSFSIQLSQLLSADLLILHVISDKFIKDKVFKEGELREYYKVILEERRKEFYSLLESFDCKDKGEVIEGDPYIDIVRYANENNFNLIVVGARGLGLIKGLFIGSVTDSILKTSHCPVFVVH
jgi:nucleotide-binding universal stress UspA family protein